MRTGDVRTVASIDLRRLFKSRDYWGPLAVVAVLFFVVIPALALTTITRLAGNEFLAQVSGVLSTLPGAIHEATAGRSPQAQAAYVLAVYMLAPIAVIVPLTVSSAVGSQSIVGERERGTGEFLAHSPLSVGDIYVGKLCASLVPGYLTIIFGFGLYALVVNVIAGPALGGWFFPTTGWWVFVLWVLPPFLAVALAVVVWVSARVQSTAAAQQATGLVALPVIILAYAVSGGTVANPTVISFWVGLLAWVVAVGALVAGGRAFQRERLLGFGG